MTWTCPAPADADAAVDGPTTGDDRAILVGYLAYQRSTLLHVCAGLTAEQLAMRPVPPSTLSLAGLIRHLAKVERVWLRHRVARHDVPPLHGGPGDPTDFDAAAPSSAEADVRGLLEEWSLADAAVAGVPFAHEIDVHGETLSLRMVYVHLIGEYARHNGHADLLRQALDGVTGR